MRAHARLALIAPLCGAPAECHTRRSFTRALDRLGDLVSSVVSEKLSTSAVFAESRAVTERRRKVEKRRPMEQNLAERLHTQRHVRQYLIPTSVKVDATKQYVTFTWPFEAQRRAEAEAARDFAATAEQAPSNPTSVPDGAPALTAAPTTRPSTPALSPNAHRTRALAEYLRAYTPSTDGTFGSNMLVYGRRGVTITDIVPMGSYALRFCFSDGHTGGIYSYEYLYDLTRPGNKYHMMRAYLDELRAKRKSRDPPNRARATRRRAAVAVQPVEPAPPKPSANDENAYRAPSFPPQSS